MKKILVMAIAVLGSVTAYSQAFLTLEQSKELALKNNITLKNSTLELEAAKQIRKATSTSSLPKVSAQVFAFQAINPIINYQMPGGNLPVYDGNTANLLTASQFAYFPGASIEALQRTGLGLISATQPIYVGGKIRTGLKLAQLGVEVREKQQLLTRDEILLNIEQQYWQLVSLQEKQKTLTQYEILLISLDKQVNDAFKSGLVIKNDQLKVQLKQSELQVNKNKLNSGHKLALRQFCQTIGLTYDSTLVLKEDLSNLPLPQSVYLAPEVALLHRTAYKLLEQSVQASRLQTKLKEGDHLPQVAVGLAGYYANGFLKGGNSISNGLIYATASLPISEWWTGKHAISEQKIREQIAENTLNDARGLLCLQLDKGWYDILEAYRQISLLEQMQIQARENLKVVQTSYTSGLVTVSDLLEAQTLETEKANRLIEARAQYKLALAAYGQMTNVLP